MKKATVFAPAKINISLDVLGKRPDGYHEVKMIMHSVPLFDTVTVYADELGGESCVHCENYDNCNKSQSETELFCTNPNVPTDSRNTAFKAAQIFLEEIGKTAKVHINIDKKIPISAGLAGGSADAAAVFSALNEIYGFPLDKARLLKLSEKVGADVPFCISGGCALSEGIGERLTTIVPLKNVWIVIAKPDFEVSTARVYGAYVPERVEKHPDTDKIISALRSGDLSGIAENTANVLESVTERKYPVISEYKEYLKNEGAIIALMSGSGPSVFGIFDNEKAAESAYNFMKAITDDAYLMKIE